MFTGIIEEVGTVDRIAIGAESAVLTISADKVLEGTKLGDSIAVNGVCLTVTSLQGDRFQADVMAETLRRSSLGALGRGSRVNLERAMAAGGRFGGHIVAGHIDGTGTILSTRKEAMPSGLRSEQVRRSCVILSRRDPLQSMGSA
nr:riboflavin synthase [Roseburia sp. AM59-24XD]